MARRIRMNATSLGRGRGTDTRRSRRARRARQLSAMLLLALVVGSIASGAVAGAKRGDPYREQQWALDVMQVDDAWDRTRGRGALVAIIDTGVDLRHPELRRNIDKRALAECPPKAPSPCDGPMDTNGHGTHIAGIIAAVADNGKGVTGIAPHARILPIKVTTGSKASYDLMVRGIRDAADMGADVITMSISQPAVVGEVWAATGDLEDIYDAMQYAWDRGSVVFVSAGNNSLPMCGEAASAPHVVCVGGTTRTDMVASYSNWDGPMLDSYVTAPGGEWNYHNDACEERILSTFVQFGKTWGCAPARGYDGLAGTSMAAPHAAAVGALLASLGLDNAEIVGCLESSSDDLGPPGHDPLYGWGRVNALRAVTECT